MVKMFFLFLVMFFFHSCSIKSGVQTDIELPLEIRVEQLNGVYTNEGESKTKYLSEVLLDTKVKGIEHEKVQFIQLEINNKLFLVKAIINECIAYEIEYVLNKEYVIDKNAVVLLKDVHFLSRGGDDPVLGPSYEKKFLSMDMENNLVFQANSHITGLAYALIPVSMSENMTERYRRIEKSNVYTKCLVKYE